MEEKMDFKEESDITDNEIKKIQKAREVIKKWIY